MKVGLQVDISGSGLLIMRWREGRIMTGSHPRISRLEWWFSIIIRRNNLK
jgi:hypothetical protein